jgi:4-hydroxy-tetrahydrodipicolinate synthase
MRGPLRIRIPRPPPRAARAREYRTVLAIAIATQPEGIAMTPRLNGVLSPVVTPFNTDFSPDTDRFVRQCQWLIANDVGLAVFGTNSEANSLAVPERIDLLESLVAAGVDPARMMPGTGASALTDSVRLTAHAVKLGCAGVLMLPPFYYKGVSDEGLYRNFSEIIERVGDTRLRVYLYHIPPVSQVPISLALIERLLKAYPGTVAGVKDSSGDWANTKAMLEQFAPHGFDVFAGSETFLLANMRHGGRGCISATANVNPAAIAALHRQWQGPQAEELQAGLDRVRGIFQKYPMIPALKHAVAHWSGDARWRVVRPPLVELTAGQSAALIEDLKAAGFSMPGLER